MKTGLLAFVVYVLANIGNYSAAQNDVNALINRIDTVRSNLNTLGVEEEHIRFGIPNAATANDFQIPENSLMVELNKSLNDRQLRRGIADCIKQRDDTAANLKQEFETIFKKDAYNKIDALISAGTSAKQELDAMKSNLVGQNLQNQQRICQGNAEACVISKIYPNRLTQIENEMARDRQAMNNVYQDVFDTSIKPTVTGRIQTEIYNPTMNCIKSK